MDIKKRWPLLLAGLVNAAAAIQVILPATSKAQIPLAITVALVTNLVAALGEKQTRGAHPKERRTDKRKVKP